MSKVKRKGATKEKKSSGRWTSVFELSALKLGILLTFGFIFAAMKYYSYNPARNSVWILDRLNEMHQASIDIRLKDRGPRAGSNEVAIVAVDEQAVEKLGRWPWPRGTIATLIDRLVEYGAKVIAFDAVFAEPDNNQAVVSLNRLKTRPQVRNITSLIDEELSHANTDTILAATVKKHSSHVILGSFFNPATENLDSHQEACSNLVYTESTEGKRLEAEDKPVIALDRVEQSLPDHFSQFLKQRFAEISEEQKSLWEKERKDPRDLDKAIFTEQNKYCERWLSTREFTLPDGTVIGKDETFEAIGQAWPEISKQIEALAGTTYEEEAEKWKLMSLHNPVERTGQWVMNLGVIEAGSKHNAYFNAFPDDDGKLRRSQLVVRLGSTYTASLALKSIMVGKNLSPLLSVDLDPIDQGSKVVTSLVLNDADTGDAVKTVPVDTKGRLLINYAGDAHMFPHVGVAEVLSNKETMNIHVSRGGFDRVEEVNKKDFFKDKYLVFGATATGIYDLRVTPFSENYPGVETHANLIDNLLRNDYLVEKKGEEELPMLGFMGTLGATLTWGIASVSAVPGLILTLLAFLGIYFYDKYVLFGHGEIVSIVLPLLMIGANYVLLTFYKYLTEERAKKAIKGTFAKYVSPAIVNEVLKHPENIELGGKKIRMSVIFSDVRGFTTISEKLDPQALVACLNEYLTPMTNLVFENKGTLDKYMGDAIMSFFGAPIQYEEHAKMACKCAVEMMDLLPKINKTFAEKGYPAIDIGIGINTGEMSVGNMGSDTVRSYTVMGDSVNLGSRLEGINKEYGTNIIISEFTWGDVKNDFHTREVDWVRVKGKLQPVRIFELMGKRDKPFDREEMVKHFNEGFEKYHARDFAHALECFKKAHVLKPDDGPTELYVERCQEYVAEPPPSDWDGVFSMKTK